MNHALLGDTLRVHADGVEAECLCGWRTGRRFSGMIASALFGEHLENVAKRIFVCPQCQIVSHNAHDVEQQYCARCHAFVADMDIKGDPFRNDNYPERPCDRCGKPYRGPAVYCSIACAEDDA